MVHGLHQPAKAIARLNWFSASIIILGFKKKKVGNLSTETPRLSCRPAFPGRRFSARPKANWLDRRLPRALITGVQFDINIKPPTTPYLLLDLQQTSHVDSSWPTMTPHAGAHHDGDTARFSTFGMTNNITVHHFSYGQLRPA
jgi:hypothetical protein